MVRGAGNIFYDLNNAAITIVNNIAAAPVSNFNVASLNICTGVSTQLNDQSINAPTSWTWTATNPTGVTFSNANAQNPTVTFANPGTYTLALTAENAIGQNTSAKTITVSTCTGITELTNNNFMVYPNPTTGNLNIDFNNATSSQIEIEVYDAIGKLVLTQTTSTNHTVISLEQFAKGIYNVKLKSNDSYSTIRVIKE